MAFQWKDPKDIWKGEGVYHLTFAVAERRPLLGRLVALTDVTRPYEDTNERKYTTKLATVRLSPLGFEISRDLREFQKRHSNILVCGKQIMETHLHVVLWVQEDNGKSILEVAKGFRQGVTKIARELGVWPPAGCVTEGREAQTLVDKTGACHAPIVPYHILEKPFIRTLSRRRQLDAMIGYVHANPDNAWMRRLHPDLYVIRRQQEHAGLLFDAMGKARLLDYPDRQVIALSRSLTPEQIEAEVQKALRKAEHGVVTYTAAINAGEKAVSRAVREAGLPLVVMMLDGFPPEGSEAARYFHPSGVYHKACGEGLLYLMAPHADNYNNPTLIARTEAELTHKAEAKGFRYTPLPHTSTRWRMIAGNVMLKMIAGEDE